MSPIDESETSASNSNILRRDLSSVSPSRGLALTNSEHTTKTEEQTIKAKKQTKSANGKNSSILSAVHSSLTHNENSPEHNREVDLRNLSIHLTDQSTEESDTDVTDTMERDDDIRVPARNLRNRRSPRTTINNAKAQDSPNFVEYDFSDEELDDHGNNSRKSTQRGGKRISEELKLQKGDPAHDKGRNVGHFRGNRSYLQLYNSSVEDFFSMNYGKENDEEFLPSKINASGSFYPPAIEVQSEDLDSEVGEPENVTEKDSASISRQLSTRKVDGDHSVSFSLLPGSLWDAKEKETFFRCLGRFSIHRIEEFQQHLPQKTLAEIRIYYNLLRRELSGLNRLEQAYGLENSHLQTQCVLNGIRYSEIPIAYEMDEEWLDYEETQSIHVANRQNTQDYRKSRKYTKDLKEYTAQGDDESINVINVREMEKLAQIFRANTLFPILVNSSFVKLGYESLNLLEELIKIKTRQIIGSIVMHKGLNGVKDEQDSANLCKGLPELEVLNKITTFSELDVWRATERLKLFETVQGGVRTRYNLGRGPVLSAYFENLCDSLRLQYLNNLPGVCNESRANLLKRVCSPYVEIDFAFRNPTELIDPLEYCPEDLDHFGRDGEESELIEGNTENLIEVKEEENDQVSSEQDDSKISDIMFIQDDENVFKYEDLPTLPISKKRTLQDMFVEDSIIQQEEENLEMLDHQNSVKHCSLLKRWASFTEVGDFESKKIHLDQAWDRTFARYR